MQPNHSPLNEALILFAHGSRDPRWADTFERMVAAVRDRLHATEPGSSAQPARVQLAYLELMTPSLAQAAATAVSAGAQRVAIAPLFLGAGSHIREDLPELLQALEQAHPGVPFELLPLLGDMPELIGAVAGIYAPDAATTATHALRNGN